jgi:hypothetical protein
MFSAPADPASIAWLMISVTANCRVENGARRAWLGRHEELVRGGEAAEVVMAERDDPAAE